MPLEFFIFLTAVVFTIFGYRMGRRATQRDMVEVTVASTISKLIADGYLKTEGSGEDMILLKVNEYEKDFRARKTPME